MMNTCYTYGPMHKPHTHSIPVTLDGLNQKRNLESRRGVREREEGIVDYVSKTTMLHGISKLIFKKRDGAKITLSYRLDKGGTLRFAREKRFANPPIAQEQLSVAQVGRMSGDIAS